MNSFAVILVAAGRSTRFGSRSSGLDDSIQKKKPFALLKGRAVWLYAAQVFSGIKQVRQLILVVSPEDREQVERKFAADLSFMNIELVEGGKERWQSVENGLAAVRSDIDFVAIHDAVRPCIVAGTVERVFDAAVKYGAAIPAMPLYGTIKRGESVADSERTDMEILQSKLGFAPNGNAAAQHHTSTKTFIRETVPRDNLWEAQTPQVFRKSVLLNACKQRGNHEVTDDAMLVEQTGQKVQIVPSDALNIKITTSFDLTLAEKYLELQSRKTANPFGFF